MEHDVMDYEDRQCCKCLYLRIIKDNALIIILWPNHGRMPGPWFDTRKASLYSCSWTSMYNAVNNTSWTMSIVVGWHQSTPNDGSMNTIMNQFLFPCALHANHVCLTIDIMYRCSNRLCNTPFIPDITGCWIPPVVNGQFGFGFQTDGLLSNKWKQKNLLFNQLYFISATKRKHTKTTEIGQSKQI